MYLVGAWAAVQVVATIGPLLHFPDMAGRLTVIAAAFGFPIALIVAWLFDLTPDGLRRTSDMDAEAINLGTRPGDLPASQTPTSRGAPLPARAAGFMGLGMLVAFVAFAAYSRFAPPLLETPAPAIKRIQSIAVLPFVDLSAAKDQEYFSDGITEELLNRLGQIDGLRIPARTSSFAFKGRNIDVRNIGRDLHVEAIVEGSVRRDADSVRISARLIDVNTGNQIWSKEFDRKIDSALSVQDEIAQSIVTALQMKFAGAPMAMPTEDQGTKDSKAHALYLQGLGALHKRTPKDLRAALDYFERAVARDPSYALAHAGLAQTYAVLPSYTDFPAEEAISKGNSAAARALSLDGMLPEAHAAMGQLEQNFEWDFIGAEGSYRKALGFNPRYASAHQWLAETLLLTGQADGSKTEVEQALALDPLSPPALNLRAYQTLVRGDVTGALIGFQKLTQIHPDYELGGLNEAYAAVMLKRFDIARHGINIAFAANPQLLALASKVVAGIEQPGKRPDAVRALESMSRVMPPATLALWYAAIADKAHTLKLLDASAKEHVDGSFPLILLHPLLAPYHDDARFRTIVREVGVTVSQP